jgi:hypothetical protein
MNFRLYSSATEETEAWSLIPCPFHRRGTTFKQRQVSMHLHPSTFKIAEEAWKKHYKWMTKRAMVNIQEVQQHYYILNLPSRTQALENSGDVAQITSGMLNYQEFEQ